MSVAGRLAKVESLLKEKGIGEPPPRMRGAIEMHCPGGLGRLEGMECEEHEDCVYTSSPIMGTIIRQYIFAWQEGMTELDLLIG